MINYTGYELIVGSSIDPQFGPVLLFGIGGQLVELFRDRALGAAAAQHHAGPADDRADDRSPGAFGGVRGRRPIDIGRARAAARALQPARRRAAPDQGDRHQPAARVTRAADRARRADRAARRRRRATPTCRGWRSGRTRASTSRRGRRATAPSFLIRPIRPEDEPLMVALPRRAHRATRSTRATSSYLGLSAANGPRAADARLLQRLRPRDRARRRARRPRRDRRIVAVGRLSRDHAARAPSSRSSSATHGRVGGWARSCCAGWSRSAATRAST